MKKNILFVRSFLKNAGPGRLMLSSAESLRDAGFSVTFTSSGGPMVSIIEEYGFEHIYIPELAVPNRTIYRLAVAAIKLYKLARRKNVSIVHAFNSHAALASFFPALFTKSKLFNTVLGYGKEKLLRFMPFRLIAVSLSVKNKLIESGVRSDKISVIYNSTLDERFIFSNSKELARVNALRAGLTPFTLIGVAVFVGEKGQRQIINSIYAYLCAGYSIPIRVILVGDGPRQQEMEALVAELDMEEIFDFVGASRTVEKFLDLAHCFIHLAELETFGIVLAEASARGLPIIASNIGGIPEVVLDQKTGYLVDRDDSGAIAEKIFKLAKDRELREKFGRNGAEWSSAMFARNRMASDLTALYFGLDGQKQR